MREKSIEEKKTGIEGGNTCLGIEFGSTRIKAVLTDREGKVLAIGTYDWENSLVDGIWTYSLEEIEAGLQGCYASLKEAVFKQYNVTLHKLGAMGISAMMHGFLALDAKDQLLAPFQTWRNTNTTAAADTLTVLFDFNIPLRWTIAHIYQRILDGEAYVKDMSFVTTLDSYIHYRLTGEKATGIGDAAGIFPIDSKALDYQEEMVRKFDELVADRGLGWKLRDILPKVLPAGKEAGRLTPAGAKLLDPSGDLESGIPLCPPEGDAGTGMVATNSVAPGTGNISCGTSTFAMLVLEKNLSKVYREIDMVTTPEGYPVAMAHANNGTTDINQWVHLFSEMLQLAGVKDVKQGDLYGMLFREALKGDADCGGLLSYGYYSGEGITDLTEGRPLFVRTPDSAMSLANFMRVHLYSVIGAVKLGMDILLKEEGMSCKQITGHGGFFGTKGVAQKFLAAAIHAPVTVMENASEGGPWGMALLAGYMLDGKGTLDEYLKAVFADVERTTMQPEARDEAGYETFIERYKSCLEAERAAVKTLI